MPTRVGLVHGLLGKCENDRQAPTMRELVRLAYGSGRGENKTTMSLRAVTGE